MSRRLNGEGNIRVRSDGRLEGRLQIGTKSDGSPAIKYFYGKTKQEIKLQIVEYSDIIKAGEGREEINLEKYMTNWLETVKKTELKPRSYDTLESTIKTHIIPLIGFYGISDLTSSIIQKELINKIVDSEFSYSTVKKAYDALNACLKFASANRVIPYNPMQTVVKPSKTRYVQKQIEIFTDDEIKLINEAAINYGRYGQAIILILYTGIRSAEALGLKWKDYNKRNRTLAINGSLVMTVNRNKKDNEPHFKALEQSTSKTKKALGKFI